MSDSFASVFSLLQIALKAGKLAFGHDVVLREIARKHVCMVILATDLSTNSSVSISRVAQQTGLETIHFGEKEQYFQLFGKYIGIIGILDDNFKKGIIKHLTDHRTPNTQHPKQEA